MAYYSYKNSSVIVENGVPFVDEKKLEVDKKINNGKEVINIHYDDNGKHFNETIFNNIRKYKQKSSLEHTLKQNHHHTISNDIFSRLFGKKKSKRNKKKTKRRKNKRKIKKKE
jgi:hypothetical protein